MAALKADLFKALGHPVRVRALEVLIQGPRSVGELARVLSLEISHLSQQLGVLRRAGVVDAVRVRSTVHYSVRDPLTAELLALARRVLVTTLQDRQGLLLDLQADPRDDAPTQTGPSGAATTPKHANPASAKTPKTPKTPKPPGAKTAKPPTVGPRAVTPKPKVPAPRTRDNQKRDPE